MHRSMLRTKPVAVAVEHARTLVRTMLGQWSLLHLEEAVAAVAVELVANAVLHARTNVELSLRRTDGGVMVEVRDYAAEPPCVIRAAPDGTSGRGMRIVQAMAASWGARPAPGGKIVWAVIEATRAGDGRV